MLKSDDDGELCVLPLFKGRKRKSQKMFKNPSKTEFINFKTHVWKIVIQELKTNPLPKRISNTEIAEPSELIFLMIFKMMNLNIMHH